MATILTPPFGILFWIAIAILGTLDLVLRAFSLWKSARNNQSGWFVCLFIFNTCGILPIIYLILNRKK
jgi:methionyl-tRNA synthetase